MLAWWADVDLDTYGDVAAETLACTQPTGAADNPFDCDDGNEFLNVFRAGDRYLSGPLPLRVQGTTEGGGDEYLPSCADNPGTEPDVTYVWRAPSTGRFHFRIETTTFNSVLTFYPHCSTNVILCNDNERRAFPNAGAALDLTEGQMVDIVIDGNRGTSGTFELLIEAVPTTEDNCVDFIDNDYDGNPTQFQSLRDCNDPDCNGVCQAEVDCTNGLDDDNDGYADCLDPGCQLAGAPCEFCRDRTDNNNDGLEDCADPLCFSDPACGVEVCDDGVDNNADGSTDCGDAPNCSGRMGCGG